MNCYTFAKLKDSMNMEKSTDQREPFFIYGIKQKNEWLLSVKAAIKLQPGAPSCRQAFIMYEEKEFKANFRKFLKFGNEKPDIKFLAKCSASSYSQLWCPPYEFLRAIVFFLNNSWIISPIIAFSLATK